MGYKKPTTVGLQATRLMMTQKQSLNLLKTTKKK